MSEIGLAEHFCRYFEAVRARDDATRREVFRLRYAVYCEELGYEDRSAFADGEERDAYDPHARFVLIRHRDSGRAAGCMRMVCAPEHDADWRFPFERACSGHLASPFAGQLQQHRPMICEVSRLAVHQDFRRRRGESGTSGGDADGALRTLGDRHYPLIAMGLFLSASALFLDSPLEQVWVMMEPRLARMLGGCGLRFTQVGDVVDFHGKRGPFRITRPEVLPHLRPDARALLDVLRKTLD